MKILIAISDQVWGGKHQYMLQIAQGLVQAGHHLVICAEEDSVFLRRAQEHAFLVYPVPNFIDQAHSPLVQLSDYLTSHEIDMVITSGRRDSLALYRSISRVKHHIGLVLFRHSAFPLPTTEEYREMLARADLVIATSQQQNEMQFQPFVTQGLLTDTQIVVLPSAIDLHVFQPQEPNQRILTELAPPSQAHIVGCVARLSWEKDHATLLRACAQLIRDGLNLFVVLVGEGDERMKIEMLIADLGIAPHVTLLGFRDDIADILSVCHLHILPSKCDETGPLVLKEAMAMAIPVIASRQGGMPEFVIHEQTGLLFESTNVMELSDCLRTIITRPDYARTLATNARHMICKDADKQRQFRYFNYLLDQINLQRFAPSRALRDFTWKSCIRLRQESFGGLLFVADTSNILELDPHQYRKIEQSMAEQNVLVLVGPDDADTRTLITELYHAGCFQRAASSKDNCGIGARLGGMGGQTG